MVILEALGLERGAAMYFLLIFPTTVPCILHVQAILLLVVPQMSKMSSHSTDCESSRPSNTRTAPAGHCPSLQQLTHGHREVYTVLKGGTGNWNKILYEKALF